MHKLYIASLLTAALTALPALGPARPLAIEDMSRIVDLEEPAITPDGRTVALIAIAQDMATATYRNSLVLVDVRTGASRTLVRGRDVAVPRWSPDGTQLAFLAQPTDQPIVQAFVRRSDGRITQLTHDQGDLIDVAWSPDGKRLAFVAADPPANRAALARHHDYFFAGDNDYTATALTPPDHLWIVPAAGGIARRITSGSWTIAPTDPGGIFSPQIAWSHDGRRIAYTRVENTFSGDSENSTLWEIDAATGQSRKLTKHRQLELSPAYSPDGTRLSYWYPLDGDFNSENTLRQLAAGNDSAAAPGLDRNVAGSLWFPDGRRLLICASDRTRTLAWTLDLSGTFRTLPLGDLNIVCDPYSSSTFDAGIAAAIAADGGIAFLATDAAHARELYYLAPAATRPRRLTHVNDFVASIDISKMSELSWEGPDGFHEDGVVTTPSACRANARCPIVLLVHGGPGLSSSLDFAFEQWPLAQMIASHGYVVLQPNYRGSDNLGNAYMHAIYRDSVKGPGDDVMSGLAALETSSSVDPKRVAVSGWSYGGLLTSWLIAQYHTWRAAVSGAAVNDEFEEYNLSTSNVQDIYALGTSPYTDDGWRIYSEQSPITYYRQITTPTLIWGTTLDPVVPIPESYSLFHALEDNHVPVRFVVFPASTHGPENPVQTADLTRLWLNWLDDHLK